MSGYRRWLRLPFGRKGDLEREVDEEIHAHIEMRVEELVARGATSEEARREAERRFGDMSEARRRVYATARRSQGRLRRHDRLGTLARDLSYALRQARRAPGFTATAVLILALGIGLTTAMFTLVDHVLLRALPFPSPEELVSLQSVRSDGTSFDLTSMSNWVDWREGNATLASTTFYRAFDPGATVDVDGEVLEVPARDVGGQFFATLRPALVLGRGFTEKEAQDQAPVVVVSEGFWRRMLGGDPEPGSRTLVVNGRRVRVVGVVRESQAFPGGTQVWIPTAYRPGSGAMRNNVNWSAVGRLRPGIDRAQAQADLTAIARGIAERDPEAVYSHGVAVKPLQDVVVEDARKHLQLLMGAAVFVLLVACANLAGLSLARARRREQEVAVRLALGAGRARVLGQIVTEHVLLALVGGLIGVLGAWWATGTVAAALDATLPRVQELAFDGRVAAFGLVAALASGILAGVLPALRASGGAPSEFLSGVRGNVGGGRGLPGAVLVGTEVALAVLLVTGGVLLVRSFQAVMGRDLGYDPEGVVTAEVNLIRPEYREPGRAALYWKTLLDELAATPGVASAGIANWIPTGTAGTGWIDLADQPDVEAGAGYRIVTEDYFETMGIPLLEGRGFDDRDAASAERTVLVNRRMSDRYWPGRSPLGRRIRARSMEQWYYDTQGLEPWLTVVGVVGDVRHYGFESEPRTEMYVLYRQIPMALGSMTAVVRADGPDVASVATAVRGRARSIDPSLAVEVDTLSRRVEGLLSVRRLFMTVLGTFAVLALFLACLGVYGLLAFAASERTREYAVRAALGARRGGIVLLTLGRAAPILAGGVGVGLVAAYWLTGFLRAQLVQVTPRDPVTYVASVGLLAAVAVLAALIPSWRAARVDPLEALRES